MVRFVRDEQLVDAGELSEEQLEVLNATRLELLEMLAEQPDYPSSLAERLGTSKQRIYYHFEKLEEVGLLEVQREENRSGGKAVFYEPSEKGYVLDLGGEGENFPLPDRTEEVHSFLNPLLENGELNGLIVTGSPEEHGPDQVRSLDGYLGVEIGFKLGNYARKTGLKTVLDTEVKRDDLFDENLLMLGGVLTNTVSKRFNGDFPAGFSSEKFPYQEIVTPENSYTDESVGIIARTSNPEDREKAIFMVAGVQSKGTLAAVKAFSDLEKVVEGYKAGSFYAVVKGLDLNGDGQIDDYRVVEKSE